jgi:hypothetical protein
MKMGWFNGLSKKMTAAIEMPLLLEHWLAALDNGQGITSK